MDHLANQFAAGRDEYPKDLQTAHATLAHYRSPSNGNGRSASGNNSGGGSGGNNNTNNRNNERREATSTANESATTLTQYGGASTGGTGDPAQGGFSVEVPSTPTTGGGSAVVTSGTTLVQYAEMMAQAELATIDPTWILLDSQSTISVFKNKDMLLNIRRSPHVLRAITNGGFQDSNMIGDFPNLGEVWYNEASIANILSLADVTKVFTVTMDCLLSISLS